MSKPQLKKELQKLGKEQLIEQICELYDTYKPVKEYYKIFLNPDSIQELFEKYKAIIVDKFNPGKITRNYRTCFQVAKKTIADFKMLNPPPKLFAELMMTVVEKACPLSNDYGDMPEQHYDNTANSFERTLKFLQKEKLLSDFKSRCKKCLKYADKCGGGFSDCMNDIYDEFYP